MRSKNVLVMWWMIILFNLLFIVRKEKLIFCIGYFFLVRGIVVWCGGVGEYVI